MANGNSKYCPLIKQVCIKGQCEFFNDPLKKCQVSVLSYNVFRMADQRPAKPAFRKDHQEVVFRDRPEAGIPFDGNEF